MFQQATDGGPGAAVVTVTWSGGLGPWLYMFPVQPGSLPVSVTGHQGVVLFPSCTLRAAEQDHILSISRPQHLVGQPHISSHKATQTIPGDVRASRTLASFSRRTASQRNRPCHHSAPVGTISTSAVEVSVRPVCSEHYQISTLLWALGEERNKEATG